MGEKNEKKEKKRKVRNKGKEKIVKVRLAAVYGSAAIFGNGPASRRSNILLRHSVATILPREKKRRKIRNKGKEKIVPYDVYHKYADTLSVYPTCPIRTSPFYVLWLCLKTAGDEWQTV